MNRPLSLLTSLLVALTLLGSSVTFCSTGDIYNQPYDQSGEYSFRWYNGREQLTPQWTPDGSHIIFGHAGRIYVVDAEGSNLRSLSGSFRPAHLYSETAEIDFSPSVSPDGSEVAFTTLRYATGSLREHTYEIATQAIDGSDRVRLTNNDWDDVSPSWSPDGARIAYVSYGTDGPRVFTIVPDGSDPISVAPTKNVESSAPKWSPDGSRLAFVVAEWESAEVKWLDTYHSRTMPTLKVSQYNISRESIYIVGPDGSNLTKLKWATELPSEPRTRVGSDLGSPEEDVTTFRWSPDGGEIAFVARYYGEPDGIFVASADGSEVRQIFDLSITAENKYDEVGWILDIAWSPDGSRISFEAGGTTRWFDRGYSHPVASVYSIGVDGSQLHLAIDKDDLTDYLRWADKLVGAGPKRIVRYTESTGPNVGSDVWGRILSTIPWGQSNEQVLVRLEDDRVVPAALSQANGSE